MESSYFNQETKKELASIAKNESAIAERFGKELEFGTGGLRGIMGAGTNRMNIYIVRKATQGLANYIKKQHGTNKKVAIAYDTRNMSLEFAIESGTCLAANGIKSYIFSEPHPTPMLSFALRQLECIAGIVITASHNPPEYNGYKVYWEDGAQITAPRDKEIIAEINAITDFTQVKTMSKEDAEKNGYYESISHHIDDRYFESLKELTIHPQIINQQAKKLRIVYTPLHGTGNLPVKRILREMGFSEVFIVPEQQFPDGNFPTVSVPNPEDPSAFDLALKLAKKTDADLVLATDPDADRLGVYAKDRKTGVYKSFTGNMLGTLILHYILSQRKALGALPDNGAVVTTIVSGKMAKNIAKDYHVKLIETLTGFKYIGEQIKFFEHKGDYEFLFGYEESYGYLNGTHARDKDAVAAVLALCEVAAWCQSQNMTLCDQMESLFKDYGYYKETLFTVPLTGQTEQTTTALTLDNLRTNIPQQIAGIRVRQFRDYQNGKTHDFITGEENPTTLPRSRVLYFELEDDAWCCIRPSGTEPKIKLYVGSKGKDEREAEEKLTTVKDAFLELLSLC